MTTPNPRTIKPYLKIVAPFSDKIAGSDGVLNSAWQAFFRLVQECLEPLGSEKCHSLENGKTTIVGDANRDNVAGLLFAKEITSQVIVDYLIQRVTTGTGAEEKIETGTFFLAYKPTSNSWVLSGGPSTSGIALSVTSAGQIQYTSTLITGAGLISKITWRARTLAAKHSSYSRH